MLLLPYRVRPALVAVIFSTSPVPATPLPIAELKRDAPVDFARDIHPLLKRSCLACHNTTKAKAGLNLESPATILKGGDSGPAAVIGKGAESLLLRTASHAEDPPMPPPGNKVNAPDLSPEDLGLLKLWVDQGLKGSAVVENVAQWRSFPTENAPVTSAALSATGRLAAAARGNRVQITEVATGLSLGWLTDPDLEKLELYKAQAPADRDAVMAVAFGGDDLLATGGFRTARLWRRAPLPAQPALELPGPSTCVAAGGKWAASGEASGSIRVWEWVADKPAVMEFKDHTAPVKALSFSPDGTLLLSAAEDKSVRVWSVESKTVVHRMEAAAVVTALCFLKSGTELAAAFADGMLRVYPFPKDAPPAPPAPLREHKLGDQPVLSLAAPDPAGTLVLWTNAEPALHLTDTSNGKRQDIALENPAQAGITAATRRQQAAQRQLEARKARLTVAAEAVKKESESLRAAHQAREKARADWQRKLEAARAADTALRAAPDEGKRKEEAKKTNDEAEKAARAFTDARTNAELAVRLTGHAAQAQAAAEGAAAAAEMGLTEATASLDLLQKALAPLPPSKAVVLLEGGKTALMAFDGGRLHWHAAATGEFLDAADGAATAGAVPLLAAAGGGFLVVRPDKKVLRLPSRRSFALERVIGSPEDPSILTSRVTALSFSSDARLLATGGGVPSRSGEVKVWNVSDGSPLLALTDPHSDTVNALAFSPDDALLATAGSDRWARVFRTDDGQRTAAFEGHSSAVLSIGWRGDGLALATGGADKTLRFWDLLDAKQTRAITSFGKEVSALTWLGTGDTVASASGDAAVRLNEEKLPGAAGFCFTVASDSAGKFVAAGGEDGILRIWLTSAKKLLLELK